MTITTSGIICVNETFLNSNHIDHVRMHDYDLHEIGGGRGKGVAIYTRKYFAPSCKKFVNHEKFQIIQLQYIEFDIVAVYISPSNPDLMKIMQELTDLIEEGKNTIICGDFNLDPLNNQVSEALKNLDFHQIVSEPTRVKGKTLDDVYTRPLNIILRHFVHPLYFSDHDAICNTIKYDNA